MGNDGLAALMDWQVPRYEAAYPLAMLAAIATFALVRAVQPLVPSVSGLSRSERFKLLAAAFVGGSFGSKLPFVISDGRIGTWEGWLTDGKTILTGLVGAYLSVELVKRVAGIRVRTGDAFALPLAASLAVGRWGCFFYGCCYGAETTLPWGLTFETAEGCRHPTQIYESLFHAAMALALVGVIATGRLRERRLSAYLIAYCLFRFLTEFVRPEPIVAAGLTAYQWTALGFAIALSIQWQTEAPRFFRTV